MLLFFVISTLHPLDKKAEALLQRANTRNAWAMLGVCCLLNASLSAVSFVSG